MRGRKTRSYCLSATTAVIGIAIGAVEAQDHAPTAVKGQATAGVVPEGVSPGESQAASPLWDSRFIGSRSASEVLARELIGARVADASGDEFAEVADLIVDPEGRITGLVLSIGGFLGIGDKRVAVPWSDVSYGGRGRPLRARAAAAQLQAAPSFQGRAGHAPAFWPPDPRRGVGVAAAREPMPEGE